MKILITGANGFLGSRLLAHLLRSPTIHHPPIQQIYISLRSSSQRTWLNKWEALRGELLHLGCSIVELDKVIPLEWNFKDHKKLPTLDVRLDRIIHVGASTVLSMSLAEARRENLLSTQLVVRLSRQHQAEIVFLSTAFADGKNGFRNYYELSKYESERCIQNSGLPYTIIKPSLIIGDRRRGRMKDYRTFFSLIRMWLVLELRVVPVSSRGYTFLVHVDDVVDAIEKAQCQNDILVVSMEGIPNRVVLDYASEVFNKPRPWTLPRWFILLLKGRFLRYLLSQRLQEVLFTFRSHLDYTALHKNTMEGQLSLDSDWQKSLSYAKASEWGRLENGGTYESKA